MQMVWASLCGGLMLVGLNWIKFIDSFSFLGRNDLQLMVVTLFKHLFNPVGDGGIANNNNDNMAVCVCVRPTDQPAQGTLT